MKLVILDRDGVINYDSPDYIKSPSEWIPIPGSLQAIAKLNAAGYTVAIATNQSGLARGYFDQQTLDAIHAKLHEYVAAYGGKIEMITYCPHLPDDYCDCRKPQPGLLIEIAERLHISLIDVPVIGDSLRDLQAAIAVSAQPILVLSGNDKNVAEKARALPEKIAIYNTLALAVEALINPDRVVH